MYLSDVNDIYGIWLKTSEIIPCFGLNTILFISLIQHIYSHQQTGFESKLEAYNPHSLFSK